MQFTPWENPMGTDGFEFVEYAAPDPVALGDLFETMGFVAIARHRTKRVTLYRQGEVNFIINAEPNSFAQRFARQHGPSVCAMAFRVQDAKQAYERALELGAWGFDNHTGPMELNVPAIKGIGDSLIYFVDRWQGKNGAEPGAIGNISIYDVDFVPIEGAVSVPTAGDLTYIDHLTHNVHRGRMAEWAEFYERLFNFREVRYFDIEGKLTGLKSKAMTSPCGKIRIPINESSDDKSQIAEYLALYHGEGIQHIAMGTNDIYATVDRMKRHGVAFQDTIATYYDLVERRLPNHGEDLEALKRLRILVDGATHQGAPNELLLQIFTQTVIGPIFFEIIQRKGDQGFGEGNFRALFESIELDQVRRGVISAEPGSSIGWPMNPLPPTSMAAPVAKAINGGVAPATYGQGDRPPRGDYAQARDDYTCDQDWRAYTPADHELYRRLHERQVAQLPGLACDEFINAIGQLGPTAEIPRFDALSEKLQRATGWEVVAVPGLIPEEAFFSLLSRRKFPVTSWIRHADEFDYVVEPDVFHDLFGHVPLLFNPMFADYMQAYGAGGLKAMALDACERLARLYWYTVEFGLIATPQGLRAYGAGILSSAGELRYSVRSPEPQRIGFDIERIMRTRYKIDAYQSTYFVIDSFAQLFDVAAPDFAPIYQRVASVGQLTATERLPVDRVFNRRGQASSVGGSGN